MTSRISPHQAEATAPAVVKPKRTRDPDANPAAILQAARAAFAERGFAGATLRDIAERAGVTHGLVIRHFESKESLFLAANQTTEIITEDFSGDLDGLPDRTAHSWVKQMEDSAGHDPLVALTRSAGTGDSSAGRLLARLRNQSVRRSHRHARPRRREARRHGGGLRDRHDLQPVRVGRRSAGRHARRGAEAVRSPDPAGDPVRPAGAGHTATA
jgi:AcrR family transcriptional regulator